MNLFWKISAVEFLLNVAVFATVVLAYGSVCRAMERRGAACHPAVLVAMFTLSTMAAMLLPVHFDSGMPVGFRRWPARSSWGRFCRTRSTAAKWKTRFTPARSVTGCWWKTLRT